MKNLIEIGWKGELDISPEDCCELCGEIVHNHLDCPACGKGWSSSDQYYDLSETLPAIIKCEECGATFTTDKEPYCPWTIWERIK